MKVLAKVLSVILICLLYSRVVLADSSPSPVPTATAGPNPSASPTPSPSSADSGNSSSNQDQQIQDIQNQITELQQNLSQARSQEKTLQSQLDTLDSQAKITTLKINAVTLEIRKLNDQISELSTRMDRISGTVDSLSKDLLQQIVSTYKYSSITPIELLFSSNGFSDLIERLKYMQVAQENNRKVLLQLEATKQDYSDQKKDKLDLQNQQKQLQAQLQDYQTQLDQQAKTKKELLAETQGQESNYEKLIAQAQAQLSAFGNFTNNAGILTNQTVCDDWGCYYNQRDEEWGNIGLDGTGYSIANYGCLMTSMAMVYTHYGHKGVTPLTINANPDNFAAYAPTYLKYTISADGITSNRVGSIIDGELSAGRPVIIGIGRGPSHFVVFVSGSGGNYTMNDPFIPNGHKISFTSHYSLSSISEIDKVVF